MCLRQNDINHISTPSEQINSQIISAKLGRICLIRKDFSILFCSLSELQYLCTWNRTFINILEQSDKGLLTQIQYPSDLRKLSVDQLPEVCRELREDIVKELSVNPGHLASSLGVAEITVALHYVFNTPEDRIVWDVGHQAYGHKILTGRREQFYTNR